VEKDTEWQGWMLVTAILSAITALGFLLNWAIRFHYHHNNNTGWIYLGSAAVIGVTAIIWLVRWLRFRRTLY